MNPISDSAYELIKKTILLTWPKWKNDYLNKYILISKNAKKIETGD